MQITSLIPGLSDAANLLTKRNDTTAPAASGLAVNSPAQAASGDDAAATAVREIFAKYDVTSITPNDFGRMIQSLYDKGAISKKDLQDLSAIRNEIVQAGFGPDDSLNLVDFYRQQVQQGSQASADPSAPQQLGLKTQRLDWLEKFATAHAQPDALGLSAVA